MTGLIRPIELGYDASAGTPYGERGRDDDHSTGLAILARNGSYRGVGAVLGIRCLDSRTGTTAGELDVTPTADTRPPMSTNVRGNYRVGV